MSDIKMSDVFDLPLAVDGNTLAENSGAQHSGFFSHRQDNAAANAINSHDALVEQNKALKALLLETKSIIESSSAVTDTVWFNDHTTLCDKIEIALEQTK